jgi:hypothetical protein
VVTVTTNTAINAVFNLIPAVFSATCSVSPSSPTVNQVVTWSASASGGTSSYTYLWSNGASGTGTTATTSYSSIGTYHATVRVADGQSTSTIQCTGTVNGPGNNSGGNNNGVTVTSGLVNGVCGATPNLCSAGDSQDLPEDDTYYRWACKGINGGIDATPSCSSLIVGEENGDGSHISCSVTGPSSPQYVNTNTVWGVENVPLGYADYNKYWMVNGTLVSQPPSSSLTLNHIFTTVGVKNVSFYFSTSTGPIYCNNPGTTTTSIILPSGSVNEQ